jgi:hypothetical protein
MDEKRVNLCIGDRSCAGGRNLAFLVPDLVNDIMHSLPGQRMRKHGGDFRQLGASKRMPDVCRQNSDEQSSENILSGGFNHAD